MEDITIPHLLHRNATEYPGHAALTTFGLDAVVTWRELRDRVAALARGLSGLGLGPGDRMIMMMPSRVEHWVLDLAAVHLGAVPCTIYATLSTSQLRYVAQHSAAKVLVLDGWEELRRWVGVLGDLPELRHLVVVDPEAAEPGTTPLSAVEAGGAVAHGTEPWVFEALWRQVRADQPVTLLYTSGTTGDPKGVLLTHRNVVHQAAVLKDTVAVPDHPRTLAYLPLAHIAERMLGIYNVVYRAGHVTIVPDQRQLTAALRTVRPHSFFGVPRVWEKLAAGVQSYLDAADPAVREAFDAASALAREHYLARAEGRALTGEQAARLAEVDAAVLRPMRAMLGLDDMRWAGSGAAPIPVDVLLFLAGLGVDVLEVWGMTETTGTTTINTPAAFRPGTVGRVNTGMELRLLDDGEIQVRGPLVCQGYLRPGGVVEPVVDADGWLSTGDVGELDGDGFLRITDRKKDLIINSSGKNISPAQIENLLRANPLIGQAAAIGDRRPYLTALIVLDEEVAPIWAGSYGLPDRRLAALAEDPMVHTAIASAVSAVNERLSRPEQIKAFRIMPSAWTPESGELTPSLKLRRRVIAEQHAAVIDEMYRS
ncbi:AMP-binding protein [Dactylosporangium sp. AC04546]|uniref:AMP-dependent synthetase/ligase n=1 Tax=Dactylosporangium sp. AC04546 TaxID=2862460 RepID=UPI001EDE1E72|nr:AMP-binding protein [Dactylosporangium sp. AC04546]WVK79011.1 AMP-binding protein [Dactylosporangium sp. AC04546]